MAPEVRAGRPATPASDVYAAGLVLNAMFGQHPVHGVLDARARAELPEWAAAVIEAACVEAEHRPADAAALRALFASVRPAAHAPPEAERRPPPRGDKRSERPAPTGADAGFAEAARGCKLRLDRPKPAQAVGAWVLDEPIGSSRFGELWKAHRRERPGEVAAIKLFSEPRFLSNLRADHALAGNLRHAGVAALLEADLHGEQPYAVMEYVDGTPLRQRLRQGPLPPRQALSIIEQILSGLSAAHALGLAHRNLKPENVLLIDNLRRDGRRSYGVKITDFGLGKAVEETVCQMSMSGIDWSEFAPYWRYLSPEQEAGDTGTAASDVYSAGLIYYEMLIGCLPPAVLRDEALRDLPGRIRPVLTRALAPAARRFATAAEFLAALREAADA
jgi:serine/threonine protein kinase